MISGGRTRWFARTLAVVAISLLTLRLASPYLHTHHTSALPGTAIGSQDCASCELESTPITDASDPIELPACLVQVITACTVQSQSAPDVAGIDTQQLRGPPPVSL